MTKDIELRLPPEVAYNPMRLLAEVSTIMGVDANAVKAVVTLRRSIDARQRRVMVNVMVRAYVDELPPDNPLGGYAIPAPLGDDTPQAVVVGAGPAGLFAALELIERGVRPIVLERGKDVDSRRKDTAAISRQGIVDPDSNYCFGEGGAGAFSDGKLYTRSKKRGPVDKVLRIFHAHGASDDILIDAHPHIGTDRLPEVIKAIRHTIINCGGRVVFGARVEGLVIDDGKVTGVTTSDGQEYRGMVILATGHSARDTYQMLLDSGAALEPKGIAVGVRLEHPQELIDRIRYHSPAGRGKWLPPAEYTMLTRVDGRAVYSFCMCPGGFIIPAASKPGQLVVNGMSPSNRGTRWANSGMVVEILPEDLPSDKYSGPLAMMHYQADIEACFYNESQSQNAPAQRMTDFVEGRPSQDLPAGSYAPGMHPARVDLLLPHDVSRRLQQGFREFGRKNRGFLTDKAVVVGDETRTSAPVRVTRLPDTLQHSRLPGLFPCGEGAGYAGGIVSAAIDGINVANALAEAMGN